MALVSSEAGPLSSFGINVTSSLLSRFLAGPCLHDWRRILLESGWCSWQRKEDLPRKYKRKPDCVCVCIGGVGKGKIP